MTKLWQRIQLFKCYNLKWHAWEPGLNPNYMYCPWCGGMKRS